MGILANFPAFVKSKVVCKNRYAFFTNRSLSRRWIWYNMTTTKGWGKPMPGEYSRMSRRRTRDTSQAVPGANSFFASCETEHHWSRSSAAAERLAPEKTYNCIEKSPDASPGFNHFYISLRNSSVNLPLVLTMALSPSRGGGPPHTLTTSPPASRRISHPAAMSQGLVPNSNWPSARPQAM